jgi:hypothetical protein
MGVGPGHDHLAGLQGLAQAVQRLGRELRYYVASTPMAMRITSDSTARTTRFDARGTAEKTSL